MKGMEDLLRQAQDMQKKKAALQNLSILAKPR
jgi:hypothetical protein